MDYAITQSTIYQLMNMRQLISKPKNWCQGEETVLVAVRLDEALIIVGGDGTAYQHNIGDNNVYPGDLSRGQIPETAWFIRQAMNEIAPEFGGLIYKWNDAPGRKHAEVLSLIDSAVILVRKELNQMLAAESSFDMSNVDLIYDIGIKVKWFPALVEKFPDRLEEIARKILDEVAALDSVNIYMRRFAFEDEEVIIATSWDDDLDMLSADADLVAYQDAMGEIDLEGDGESETLLMPVPASEAGYLH